MRKLVIDAANPDQLKSYRIAQDFERRLRILGRIAQLVEKIGDEEVHDFLRKELADSRTFRTCHMAWFLQSLDVTVPVRHEPDLVVEDGEVEVVKRAIHDLPSCDEFILVNQGGS